MYWTVILRRLFSGGENERANCSQWFTRWDKWGENGADWLKGHDFDLAKAGSKLVRLTLQVSFSEDGL